MTYLDYQATTPLAPEALDAMMPWLRDGHANPHSPHRPGRMAKAAVEVARAHVAALMPSGGRVVFTSGATEALNWAIKGSDRAIVTQATEHAAVLDTVAASGRKRVVLPVDRAGRVDPAAVAQAVRDTDARLVAVMLVNNEIGTIQPVEEIAAAVRPTGALLLCDAVQGFGRVAIPEACDMVAVSAHKIHGPKGIGALWLRDGVTIAPLLHGGDQEGGRSGTLSPALCAGFGAAAVLAKAGLAANAAHVARLFAVVRERLAGWTMNGAVDGRWPGNVSVRRDGLDVARLMSDVRDVAFSAGSACASGSGRTSHVLRAIGLSDAEARTTIRIGFGRYTSEAELATALDRLAAAADAQRVTA
ncbi:aminotransferase [Sphingomonas sp. Leaf231]|uniref:cysteine desulfurase family protein n=1 Tax=Sphingomonas sp. Leaf231 TaxID=1736301 RepID=UPI0006F756E6|nr:cysteine desulfurase family protein [Sphingomonas sp. Leaf231]KQN94453.1 aminotransferase [Sphingomonas sp. Leaf231]